MIRWTFEGSRGTGCFQVILSKLLNMLGWGINMIHIRVECKYDIWTSITRVDFEVTLTIFGRYCVSPDVLCLPWKEGFKVCVCTKLFLPVITYTTVFLNVKYSVFFASVKKLYPCLDHMTHSITPVIYRTAYKSKQCVLTNYIRHWDAPAAKNRTTKQFFSSPWSAVPLFICTTDRLKANANH